MDDRYDTGRMGAIITDIERYLSDMRELGIGNIEDLLDKKNFYAASTILFSLLNRILDPGNEIVMAKPPGIPPTCRDSFTIMEKGGHYQPGFGKTVLKACLVPESPVPEYHGIRAEDIMGVMSLLDTITGFVADMKDRIRRDMRNM